MGLKFKNELYKKKKTTLKSYRPSPSGLLQQANWLSKNVEA